MKSQLRLTSLDGLRGIAILLVLFSHLPSEVWYNNLPYFFHPIIALLTGNGKVGVSMLFFLTGFLMAWLYPSPKSILGFWSRRYARLFPAFLVMVGSWWMIRANPQFGILESLATVVICALLGRVVWEGVTFLNQKIKIGNWLLISWMIVQVSVAIWYSAYLLRVPAQVYYELWPNELRLAISALVNGTLTLPFGNYIGQLDGVYWSLVTEVLFYILYPLLFVPLFKYIHTHTNKTGKIILILSVLPFCFGLNLLAERILNFKIILPQLVIYFIFGVAVGLYLPWFQKITAKVSLLLTTKGLALLLFLNLISVFALQWTHPFYLSWYSILLVFPMTALVSIATLDNKSWSRWLTQKWLVSLGTISYSLYLTHSLVIELTKKILPATTLPIALIQVLVIIAISILLSVALYWIVEKPYYAMRKKTNQKEQKDQKDQNQQQISWFEQKKPQRIMLTGFAVIMILLIYNAYRLPLAFFTISQIENRDHFLGLLGQEHMFIISEQPLKINFQANENNLGMIITSLNTKAKENAPYSDLWIRLKDSNNKLITENAFSPNLIIDSNFHAFGFPQITDAKNKNFTLEYELLPPNPKIKVELKRMERDFIAVYFVQKSQLFSDPTLLLKFLTAKVTEPLMNPLFWLNLVMVLPLLSYLSYLLIKKRT